MTVKFLKENGYPCNFELSTPLKMIDENQETFYLVDILLENEVIDTLGLRDYNTRKLYAKGFLEGYKRALEKSK